MSVKQVLFITAGLVFCEALFCGVRSSDAGLRRHNTDDSLYTDLAAEPQSAPVGQLGYSNGAGRATATLIGEGDNRLRSNRQ